jgi:hypothetical protein
VLLAKTTPALVFLLALVLAVLVTLAMRLALSLVVLLALLLCCSVRSRSAAAAPPSASLPSSITGRRIRSLIHIALYVVSFPAGRGTFPLLYAALAGRISALLSAKRSSAAGIVNEI